MTTKDNFPVVNEDVNGIKFSSVKYKLLDIHKIVLMFKYSQELPTRLGSIAKSRICYIRIPEEVSKLATDIMPIAKSTFNKYLSELVEIYINGANVMITGDIIKTLELKVQESSLFDKMANEIVDIYLSETEEKSHHE